MQLLEGTPSSHTHHEYHYAMTQHGLGQTLNKHSSSSRKNHSHLTKSTNPTTVGCSKQFLLAGREGVSLDHVSAWTVTLTLTILTRSVLNSQLISCLTTPHTLSVNIVRDSLFQLRHSFRVIIKSHILVTCKSEEEYLITNPTYSQSYIHKFIGKN